jgi:hypothetical protein
MLPHVHLLLGLSCANIFANFEIEPFYLYLFVIGSVLPDIDYIFSRISENSNHREFITHFPSLYLIGSIFTFLLNVSIFWISLGCLFHTLIDILDFKIYLFAPIHSKSYSIIGVNYENTRKNKSFWHFLKFYYKNEKIIAIELLSILLLVLSVIF